MVAVKAASNSSVSSSASSASSGVTSTVQRTRHIPISIASGKKSDASPQLRRPSPKQSTVRVQLNEFSVDFGNGEESASTSKEKKPPSIDSKSGTRRSSTGSNSSNSSNKKPGVSSSLQKPTISSINKRSESPKSSDKQKSIDENAQQIVVAEIHQSAEVEDVPVEQPTPKDDNHLREPSHEDEYRNSQTSDSVAGEDDKLAGKTAQETPKKENDVEELKLNDNQNGLLVAEQESEIEVDVSERKKEEGQITTKIILDSQCRAVAARDLEIEIRREVQTEVSPPISPKPSLPKVEEPIEPFVFKESQMASDQKFRDVSLRVESIEPEPKKEATPIEEVKIEDQEKASPSASIKEVKIEEQEKASPSASITQKSSTPMEEVKVDVEERKKSDADLAEVRVYRERYSEAPILPYPSDNKPLVTTSGTQPKLDLSNVKPAESADKSPTSKRPVITPLSPAEKSATEKPAISPTLRPRIISNDDVDNNQIKMDEELERRKREPIRLNIASSLHSPPATSPHSPPSQYENRQPQNGDTYPSTREINGLYRPHPLYPNSQIKESEKLSAFVPTAQSTTKTTTKTTLIATNGEAQQNEHVETAASPTPSGRLSRMSVGTGERSEDVFTPRTLSRIKHLNVIMECGSEKDNGEVIHHHPIFMRDTSKFWYKPTITREEAIAMLKDKEPGTFVVRDSNSFPGAFGLALKVSQAPAGVQPGDGTELVRHFLIEPSAKGVRLKGCSNEPVFGTLAALIYQHSITPSALPAKLILPDYDPATTPEHLNANQALLERGAACNVTYICSLDTESLTGPEAVRRAVSQGMMLLQQRGLRAVPVHFKVSSQGITLTDNTRSLFFRRHYPLTTVTFAGIDPESRLFDNNNAFQLPPTYIRQAPMFGFVARKSPSSLENTCHVFAELDPEQPASAVVRFITNVMLVYARAQQQQIHKAVAGV